MSAAACTIQPSGPACCSLGAYPGSVAKPVCLNGLWARTGLIYSPLPLNLTPPRSSAWSSYCLYRQLQGRAVRVRVVPPGAQRAGPRATWLPRRVCVGGWQEAVPVWGHGATHQHRQTVRWVVKGISRNYMADAKLYSLGCEGTSGGRCDTPAKLSGKNGVHVHLFF